MNSSITCLPKDILREIYFLKIEYKTYQYHKKLISMIKTCSIELKEEQEQWMDGDNITFFQYVMTCKFPMTHLVKFDKWR